MRPRRGSGSGESSDAASTSAGSSSSSRSHRRQQEHQNRSRSSRPMLRDDEEEDEVVAEESGRVEDSMSADQQDVICYQCEHEACESEDVATCSGFACFSFHVTEGSPSAASSSSASGSSGSSRSVDWTGGQREYFKKGCSDVQSYGFHCRSQSFRGKNPNAGRYVAECCKDNFCNNETASRFLDRVSTSSPVSLSSDGSSAAAAAAAASSSFPFLLILLPAVILLLASILTYAYYIYRRQRSEKPGPRANGASNRHDTEAGANVDELCHFMDREPRRRLPNGTRAAAAADAWPQLKQLTLAGEIAKEGTAIGSGCFGSVFKGWYKGEAVAIKVFPAHRRSFFERECDLHSMQMFRHTNILGFVGSDVPSLDPGVREYWLVSELHDHGSLLDHLRDQSVCMRDAHSMLRSAAAGLVHLHLPLHTGTTSKPGIAHRNLKPSNLLMKRCRDRDHSHRWELVIADFGLAVTQADFDSGSGQVPLIVGTTRYMAPELLDDSIHNYTDLFSVLTKSDIYSFALIMWETLRRVQILTESGDKLVLDYQAAFEELLPHPDPTHEQVHSLVVKRGQRPQVPAEWGRDRRLSCMRDMMTECWKGKPDARLTIKKIHNKLLSIWKEDEQQQTSAV